MNNFFRAILQRRADRLGISVERLQANDRGAGRIVESVGMRQAKLRPRNFADLSAQEQWQIDKRLGILDWDGT